MKPSRSYVFPRGQSVALEESVPDPFVPVKPQKLVYDPAKRSVSLKAVQEFDFGNIEEETKEESKVVKQRGFSAE